MTNTLLDKVVVTRGGVEIPSLHVLSDDQHTLCATADESNRHISLKFSSRAAMYDFARSLLQESVYGASGQKEFYPLVIDGKALVVEGARLTVDSARLVVFYE